MFAVTIALYHKEFSTNPERISKPLLEHVSKLNWNHIDFPASYKDYAIFEKLKEDIALYVLYVPFNQKTICSKYISSRNCSAKKQITLLKINDNKEKWHFLVLPSIPTEDGYLGPTKSFSRLMEEISSKSHGDFYCYGCFYSFRTQSTLKNIQNFVKIINFVKQNYQSKVKTLNIINHEQKH